MILIFGSKAILDEIGASPDILGGIGPVLIGTPVTAKDGRVAISHNFSDVDLDWFKGYTQKLIPPVVIVDKLPKDFVLASPI
jgi:hypothetical protein